MEKNKTFNIIVIIIVALTVIIAALIATSIFQTKWTKELIQLSLERGQNPMYVKCAMESNPSNECKTLITALAVARSDK